MDKNVKLALIIGGIIIAALIIVPSVVGAVYGWQGGDWGMMGPGMMGGFGWGWFMPIFPILFLGLIIWAVVALARGSSESRGTDSSKADSAMEVLKQRYARGEINKEEYEEKKKDIA